MQSCWTSGFFFECENISISVSKAANRSSWYSLEIHSSKSSNVTSFHVLFTTSRVMGTPRTGKKYHGVFNVSRRGEDEKTDGPCEPSVVICFVKVTIQQ